MTVSIDSPEVTHVTELRGVVYEDLNEELTDHDFVRALCPDTPDALVDDLVQATKKYAWGVTEGYNEYELFREQYAHIKQVAYRELGLTALELYNRYQLIVEAAILKVTNWGDITGDFLGNRAREDAKQWMIRQIQTDTFDIDANERIFTTGDHSATAGHPFHVVPRNAVAANTDTYTTVNDKQMVLIFYYQSDLSPRVLECISERIADSLGWRAPFDIYSQLQRGNTGIATRPGCLVVDDNEELDINAWCLANAETDIMPQGVDIITRDEIQELNE